MNKNIHVGILLVSFSLSSVNAGWAAEMVNIPPIIVQTKTVDLGELKEEMLEQDRLNRDQELVIKGLMDDNEHILNSILARTQDATLEQINQTMTNYRNALLSRDEARIAANGEHVSKYYDLIHLTEDVDDMKDLEPTLRLKKESIAEKYKMLSDLKDQMVAMNDKLKNQADYENFKATSVQQEAKIQSLTQQLGDMDQKIERYDAIIAEKDKEIALLQSDLNKAKDESTAKDAVIQEEQNKIAVLQKMPPSPQVNTAALSPIIVNGSPSKNINIPPIIINQTGSNNHNDQDTIIKEKDEVIRRLSDAINALKNRPIVVQAPAAPAPVLQAAPEVVPPPAPIIRRVVVMNDAEKDKIIKQKDQTIHWLQEVLDATKSKASYYQLTSQKDRLSVEEARGEMKTFRDEFTARLKDYNQFEKDAVSLRSQAGQMDVQLAEKKTQVELLKSELENRITYEKKQQSKIFSAQDDLKSQIEEKENQIAKMKADMQTMKADDRLKLASQLVGLQEEEASLLQQINDLEKAQNDLFDSHASHFEAKIKSLLADHQVQVIDLQGRLDEITEEMKQKQHEITYLRNNLEQKINQEKDQSVLNAQIGDLQAQLQSSQEQVKALNSQISAGQTRTSNIEALKQQLADAQDKANALQQRLDNKTSEAGNINSLVSEYQQKLEAKNNAYNAQIKQIADLTMRLQEKENQIMAIRKNMYDMQQQSNTQSSDAQTKDLALSMVQQKVTDDKIRTLRNSDAEKSQQITDLKADLAMARQQLQGIPNIDEITFLRSGLKKATTELAEKTALLAEVKANAAQYEQQYKEESSQFQSLKQQLQDAEDDLSRKTDDYKYKQMELVRFKERAAVREGDLQDQINALKHEHGVVYVTKRTKAEPAVEKKVMAKKLWGKTDAQKVDILQEELRSAHKEIQDMETQLNQFQMSGAAGAKLKQALDKIESQGHVINVLVEKLQSHGDSVDLSRL